MATKKKVESKSTNDLKQVEWPKVIKGTHLTVYHYADGSTKLEWDDEILLKEIKDSTKNYDLLNSEATVITKNKSRKKKGN